MLAHCPASTADGWAKPRQSSPHRSTSGYPPAPAEYPSGKTTLPRRSPSRSGRPEDTERQQRSVHPGNSPVPFHLEYRSRLFRGSVHHSLVLPEWMDLLSTTPEGASDAGVAEFGPEDPWLQSLSPVNLG